MIGVAYTLALSILAILPIRTVFVPGDISGVTRFDLVLGLDVAFSAAVVLVASAASFFSGPRV